MDATDRRSLRLSVSLLFLGIAAWSSGPLLSQAGAPSPTGSVVVEGGHAVAGEVLVQFDDRVASPERADLAQQIDALETAPVGRRRLERFRSRTLDVEALLAFFRAQPGVVFAEPNYIVQAQAIPNDPQFPALWGLLNSGQVVGGVPGIAGADVAATDAWDVSTGSAAHVIAIIDTGVDYTHPDLAANLWAAPAAFAVTIGGRTITCPAGTHGFNALTRKCDPMDDDNHGTHVAGIIGAAGNNAEGVTGINWTTSIIAGKFLGPDGLGTVAGAVDAIDFMVQTRAAFAASAAAEIRVLNNSWGGGGDSLALRDAIAHANAHDMLVVAAAGNGGADNDLVPFYPASYDLPNVVAVTAVDNTDHLAPFSNYGRSSVALAAPGVAIVSTTAGNGYAAMTGTSMATPFVAGAAALLLSRCPLDTDGLKNALLANVDVVAALTGIVSTAGRLNASRAIRSCGPAAPPPPRGVVASAGDRSVTVRWLPAAGASSYAVRRATNSGGPYTTLVTNLEATDYLSPGLIAGLAYYYVVAAANHLGESLDSVEVSATPFFAPPRAPKVLNAAPGESRVSLNWSTSEDASSYRVWRSLARSGPFAPVAETGVTNFVDRAVTNGIRYYYTVTAVNAGGESRQSHKEGAFPAPVPAPPPDVTAEAGPDRRTIVLSWSGSDWATAYKVMRSASSGGPYSSIDRTTTTGFTDVRRPAGRRYYYQVTAVNASGESRPSAAVSAEAR